MTHFDEIRAVTAEAARLASVPFDRRDAVEVARLAVRRRALVQAIGGEHADRTDPDGPCYDARAEFDRNRARL